MTNDQTIGRRLRQVRTWRRMSLRAVADLAGISQGHLSRIERGERPIDRRSLLESLAQALRVAPDDLAAGPWPASDSLSDQTHSQLAAIELALAEHELGSGADVDPRPWAEVRADVARLVDHLRDTTDYAAQSALIPGLLAELHALYVNDAEHRRDVQVALFETYRAAAATAKSQRAAGLPQFAAFHARRVAEELGEPGWLGVSTWVRGNAIGAIGRERQLRHAVRAIDDLSPHIGNDQVVQVTGALHLSAALSAAARGDTDTCATHLDEAAQLADQLEHEVNGFAGLWFGRQNVAVWRVSLATELGEAGRAIELAEQVRPDQIPSPSRRAQYHADLGRSLATERRHRDHAIAELSTAERLAPQAIRSNIFVRETVGDLMRRTREDALGRELRGLAYRFGMGVTAPIG